MRRILAIVLALSAVAAGARTWTLEECVDYAVEHNIDVLSRRIEAGQSENEVTAAKDAFLPQVSAYGSQSFNFGRGLTADNTYANRNTTSTSFGAQLNLPIFQGLGAVRRLDYSRTALKASLQQVEAAKDDVTLNVIAQYLQALYASEMTQVARINLAISTAELLRRGVLIEEGRLPELDIHEARAQVANDELGLTNALNDSITAVLDLAQLLNLPSADDFELAPLADDDTLLPDPGTVFANALSFNHTILAQQYNAEAAGKNVAVAKSGYLPTLNFSAGLGTNYYRTSGFDNETFSQQMRHNFAKSIGFSLNVPLFDAFNTRNSVRRARAQEATARLQLDDARNRLYKAIVQAHTQAVAAAKKAVSADVAVESNKAAFDAMQIKIDNGRATATEYETSKQNYMSALAQAVQAKYERILRARILNFYNSAEM